MTEQEISDLALAQTGDPDAMSRFVRDNSSLVWSIVRRFMGRGAEADDLYQLGCLGLVKAIRAYDPAYGTQFSTYAVPKISGEIRRFLRDDGAVKVSRTLKERSILLRSTRQIMEQSLGRDVLLSEVAYAMGITPEEAAEAENAALPPDSIQRENGEDGFSLEQILSDDSEMSFQDRITVRDAVSRLPDKEREVISFRFYHGLTQCDTARILCVSQVQVSRLERRALLRLRTALSED